jgi:hypothetical protein
LYEFDSRDLLDEIQEEYSKLINKINQKLVSPYDNLELFTSVFIYDSTGG